MFVVNASNIDKKFNWLSSKLIKDVKIKNMSDRYSMIAIQGPKSREVIQSIVQEDISNLKFYNFIEKINCLGKNIMLSRTGYTGELGYEILCEGNVIVDIWTHIIKNFESSGLKPAGLGARDTLRIEMGYLLYGNDINLNIDPFKAGLGWITSLNKGNFIGKREIISKKNSMKSKIIYFEMLDKGIPRPGFDILINDKTLGHVTSGTISPSLNKGIGIGYLKKKYIQKESIIFIRIRDNIKKAKIVKPPFYTSGTLRY
jgi:aminomethyltransferase